MTFTQKYSRKQIRRERPILTNSCPYGIVESETKYLLISSVVCFAYCWRRSYGAPFICVACNEWKALPHNSSAALAMSFPPSAACKFLDLPPVNLRNLHLHLTKNPFASLPPHLCGVTLNFIRRGQIHQIASTRAEEAVPVVIRKSKIHIIKMLHVKFAHLLP